MQKVQKKTSKKASWATPHPCINCKKVTDFLLCDKCGKLSIKK